MATACNYVGAVDANLICCICRSPFIEPTTTRTCAHTFCYDCIIRSIHIAPQCPVDRSPLAPGDLAPADPVVRNLVDELPVECPERAAGCTYTGQRQLLASHLRETCQYVRVHCEAGGCGAMILRKDQGHHKHSQSDASGENEPSGRGEHDSTLAEPLQKSSADERDVKLSEENAILKIRVEALEGLVRILTKEMRAVKTALGPWFKPETQTAPSTSPISYFDQRHIAGLASSAPAQAEQNYPFEFPQPSDEDLSYAPAAQLDRHEDMSNADSDGRPFIPHLPAPWPLNESATPETYAYLSALTSSMYPSNAFTADPHPSPPHTHAPLPPQLAPSGSSPSYPGPSAVTPIAPLNLSTTLYDALSGLHESVVSASTNLDSLARRTEITMNTDRAMMAEEMRAVKAAVHGLRMQVHAIMMDRNAQVTGRTSVPPHASLDNSREDIAGLGWSPLIQHLGYPRPFPPPPLSSSIPKL
ncbi:hypothetical protein NEOLEDRAFT_1136982 [Neolentinus lepideus HHB14362 ss-1]|uniref:RING-type domain-containing protein n=1 Tax=Neolentinus lepideus HHB14362 ss-1 TaxID=1314782 RepID=A0A165QZS7_9AGAM|nr:hypothetical protein NEOLEDRAFT_1136982 [Neolentinus lepideus HHB14362 ss-1]